MKWENLLLLPFFGFIEWPLAALAPAALFGFLFYLRQRRFIAFVAAAWALYAFYELMLKLRIWCSGECNIRVDLLLIIPVLWIVSIAGVVAFFRKRRLDGAA